MMIRKVFLSVAALMLVASVADAQKKYKLGKKRVETQCAGKKTANFYGIGSDTGDFRAMWEITGKEKHDDAFIAGKDRHLNSYKTETYAPKDYSSFNSPKTIGFTDPDTFIRGIAVCLNKGKTEVKGIKLTGVKLNRASGTLSASGGTKKWERPNCKWWGDMKSCPAGMVASLYKLYYTKASVGWYTGVKGLSLICRKVIPKP